MDKSSMLSFDHLTRVPIITLTDEVDHAVLRQVDEILKHASKKDRGFVIVNVADVSYLDSSALHLLISFSIRLANNRQQLIVVNPKRSPLKRLFEICGFSQRVDTRETMEEAIQVVRTAPRYIETFKGDLLKR